MERISPEIMTKQDSEVIQVDYTLIMIVVFYLLSAIVLPLCFADGLH